MYAQASEMTLKINEMAIHLIDNGTVRDLQEQHMKLFGVASRSKNKQALAEKIAKELMSREVQKKPDNSGVPKVAVDAPDLKAGQQPSSDPNTGQQPPKDPGPTSADFQAAQALGRVKSAWEEVKLLKQERKEKKAEQTKVIADHTKAIDEVLNSSDAADMRVDQVETHWRVIKRAKDKRASISEEYNKRINSASSLMEKELGDIRQGVLPFDITCEDEDDDGHEE